MDDLDGLSDTGRIQGALQGDFEIVTSYGLEHPDVWAGAWWDNQPTVRIVAAFTGDAAPHDWALRPRLQHPDRLVVEAKEHSLSELRRVRQEIEGELRQRQAQTGRPIISSIGEGKAVISVRLRPDQEQVASELVSRYGSAVELRVGHFGYPVHRPRRRSGVVRPPEEQPIEGLELSVEVDRAILAIGETGHGRLLLRNTSSERIGPLQLGQPVVGSLLNSALERVGGYSGMIAGTGRRVELAPGETASLGVTFGTASTRLDLGYTLPSGQYWLKVQIRLDQDHVTPPAPLVPIMIAPGKVDQPPQS